MKKTFIVLAAMLVTSVAAKAWEVGDYYNLDGVPSIVVWVDSTGEHGLRMSPQADFYENYYYKHDKKIMDIVEKQESKGKKLSKFMQKDSQESKMRWQSVNQYNEVSEWQKNHAIEIHKTKKSIDVSPLLNSNSEMGEINMKAILQFCEDNNYDMQTYFPAFYWATTIGDKWFIPGSYEVELISKIITPGIGIKQNYMTTIKNMGKYRQKTGLYLSYNLDVTGYAGAAFDIEANIMTSTMILSDWTKDKNNIDKLVYLETTKPTMSGQRKVFENERTRDYEELMRTYIGNQTHIFISLCLMNKKNGLDINNWQQYYLLYENLYEKYTGYDYTKFDGTMKVAVSYF